jgi:hypothetical protein
MTLNQSDKAVIAACGSTFLTFLIETQFGSVWFLYLNLLFTAGIFGYAIRKESEYASHLSRSLLFGVAAVLVYAPLDWKFTVELERLTKGRLVYYLHPDIPWMPTAPLSIILTWVIMIAVTIYLYQRVNAITANIYISAAVTGIVVLVGSTVLGQLGSARFLWFQDGEVTLTDLEQIVGSTRLWAWDANLVGRFPHIGAVPILVPLTLFFTFLLSPYFWYKQQHPVVAGLRCGIFMGAILVLNFLVIRHFATVMSVTPP